MHACYTSSKLDYTSSLKLFFYSQDIHIAQNLAAFIASTWIFWYINQWANDIYFFPSYVNIHNLFQRYLPGCSRQTSSKIVLSHPHLSQISILSQFLLNTYEIHQKVFEQPYLWCGLLLKNWSKSYKQNLVGKNKGLVQKFFLLSWQ